MEPKSIVKKSSTDYVNLTDMELKFEIKEVILASSHFNMRITLQNSFQIKYKTKLKELIIDNGKF